MDVCLPFSSVLLVLCPSIIVRVRGFSAAEVFVGVSATFAGLETPDLRVDQVICDILDRFGHAIHDGADVP